MSTLYEWLRQKGAFTERAELLAATMVSLWDLAGRASDLRLSHAAIAAKLGLARRSGAWGKRLRLLVNYGLIVVRDGRFYPGACSRLEFTATALELLPASIAEPSSPQVFHRMRSGAQGAHTSGAQGAQSGTTSASVRISRSPIGKSLMSDASGSCAPERNGPERIEATRQPPLHLLAHATKLFAQALDGAVQELSPLPTAERTTAANGVAKPEPAGEETFGSWAEKLRVLAGRKAELLAKPGAPSQRAITCAVEAEKWDQRSKHPGKTFDAVWTLQAEIGMLVDPKAFAKYSAIADALEEGGQVSSETGAPAPRAPAALWSPSDGEEPRKTFELVGAILELANDAFGATFDVERSRADTLRHPFLRVRGAVANVLLKKAHGFPFENPGAVLWSAITNPSYRLEEFAAANLEEVLRRCQKTSGSEASAVSLEGADLDELDFLFEQLASEVQEDLRRRARKEADVGFAGKGTPFDEAVLEARARRALRAILEREYGSSSAETRPVEEAAAPLRGVG